ncbi:MAG: tetratricopeptide repeat protein [Steroidobacteraceae bacterium]
MNRLITLGIAFALAFALPAIAVAQYQQPAPSRQPAGEAKGKEDKEDKEDEEPKPEYGKEFRKLAAKVATAANDKKWPEVLAALPELEALPSPTRDEQKAIATWRLQATQGVDDQDAFAAAIESFLAEGFAEPENVGAMHRQLAAHYSAKQDKEKTLLNFQKFVDATPDVQTDEYETLGRLHLQANHFTEAAQYLGKAIELSTSKNEKPKEMWFQLRDRCFIEMKDDAGRVANLEALVSHYPDKEYYSRIVAIYQAQSQDDRVVMLNAYRLAVSDPQGGLATVGGYLNYADTALVAGSPGEAARALERGMKEGVVPSAGTNRQTLTEAKNAVAQDKKSLPAESAAAAKNAKGEVDVKVGLGFYSTGEFEKAVEAVSRGIAKGGVARLDDANLLLGASLLELGRRDEARAAFVAAATAAAEGSPMKRIAGLWVARVTRSETPTEPAPAAG